MTTAEQPEVSTNELFDKISPEHRTSLRMFCEIVGGTEQRGLRAMLFVALAKRYPHLRDASMVESVLCTLMSGLRQLHIRDKAMSWPSVVQLAELGNDEYGGDELKRLLPHGAWPSAAALQAMQDAYNAHVGAMYSAGVGF